MDNSTLVGLETMQVMINWMPLLIGITIGFVLLKALADIIRNPSMIDFEEKPKPKPLKIEQPATAYDEKKTDIKKTEEEKKFGKNPAR